MRNVEKWIGGNENPFPNNQLNCGEDNSIIKQMREMREGFEETKITSQTTNELWRWQLHYQTNENIEENFYSKKKSVFEVVLWLDGGVCWARYVVGFAVLACGAVMGV